MDQIAFASWDTPAAVQSWRIRFSPEARPEDSEAIVIREPSETTATLIERRPEEAFAPPDDEADAFTLVWAPPSVGAPTLVERNAEAWMRDGRAEDASDLVRASVRTVRVVWGKDRAVIFCAAAERKYAIDAVARFTVTQREVSKLEEQIRVMWGPLRDDVALTHSVKARDQRRQRVTDNRTEQVARMKLSWLRLSTSLEQLDPTLSDLSKRIYAELVAAAALHDRIEMSEDAIQFALDQYEVANTRLIESKIARQERVNAVTGYLFEATIILLLAYEILHR